MKKVISILLSVIMAISVIASFDITAFAGSSISSAARMYLNSTTYCSITTSGTTQYYYFTPSTTGTYQFYSTANGTKYDTYGYIFDAGGNRITYNDDGGSDNNFSITYNLKAGTKYYFGSRMYSSSQTGSFYICLQYASSSLESTNPTGSISVSNDVTSEVQSVALNMSDNSGVAGYYWGTSGTYYNNSYSSVSGSTNVSVSQPGTYYLTVRDIYGNLSPSYSVKMVKTTLNANGGSVSPGYVITKAGDSFTLPVASKYEYTYNGWSTSSSSTSGITTYAPTSNTTLYAAWDPSKIYISYGGQTVTRYFTPTESGVYVIYTTGGYDTFGTLYDNNGNELAIDDDGGSGNNYSITKYLYAGIRYRIDSRMLSARQTGSFELNVAYSSCDHRYDYYTVAPTCTARGYTVYECPDCGYRYNGNYKSALGHNYITTTTKATTSRNGSIVTKCTRCGSVSKTTAINYPKTVTLSATSYTYNGKVKKPTVTVKDSAGKVISSSNYTVSYSSGRKAIGTYTVTVKFKGNYSGTVKKTFNIKPKASLISSLKTPSKGKVKINWKKVSGVTGYQIQISTKSDFKSSTKSVNCKAGKTSTTGKLTSKKKFYFRIRTYKTVKVNGKNTKIYSSWSKAKSIKIK